MIGQSCLPPGGEAWRKSAIHDLHLRQGAGLADPPPLDHARNSSQLSGKMRERQARATHWENDRWRIRAARVSELVPATSRQGWSRASPALRSSAQETVPDAEAWLPPGAHLPRAGDHICSPALQPSAQGTAAMARRWGEDPPTLFQERPTWPVTLGGCERDREAQGDPFPPSPGSTGS